MRSIEVRVDVSEAAGKGEALTTSATVFLPDRALSEPVTVFFGFPGGGYNRRYFDLQLTGRSGYSQAEFHTAHGAVFVACDHLAVGDSSVPVSPFNHADLARANAATVDSVLHRMRSGQLAVDLGPIEVGPVVGLGQSYGGLLLTVLQANHPTFDGVGFLGWSGINTVVPSESDVPQADAIRLVAGDGLNHPNRSSFHWPDVPEDIVAEDMTGYPFRPSGRMPAWASPMMPGGPNVALERSPLGPAVVDEAAAIRVPVLVAVGETDVCPDPWAEPSAYRRSLDITLVQFPRMAHMHNFAGTRELLWRRLEAWAGAVNRSE